MGCVLPLPHMVLMLIYYRHVLMLNRWAVTMITMMLMTLLLLTKKSQAFSRALLMNTEKDDTTTTTACLPELPRTETMPTATWATAPP